MGKSGIQTSGTLRERERERKRDLESTRDNVRVLKILRATEGQKCKLPLNTTNQGILKKKRNIVSKRYDSRNTVLREGASDLSYILFNFIILIKHFSVFLWWGEMVEVLRPMGQLWPNYWKKYNLSLKKDSMVKSRIMML